MKLVNLQDVGTRGAVSRLEIDLHALLLWLWHDQQASDQITISALDPSSSSAKTSEVPPHCEQQPDADQAARQNTLNNASEADCNATSRRDMHPPWCITALRAEW
eukprot:CAMPEP_0181249762 /NCGR_PEP_ID=MMETSP1096-20121128/45944_1 /TAXON_ID=156174 ORGANISM="Chrysochromulina ericina, Strain CCMP281" /NCGR_SAMPLE_ID=MMETSP1096 /ASSEMBLY_ACC=CAM_ASM_000453 /LENGTH=104 /DNA_ID=CAMNT_0023347155 /DNA_START=515 /DNA_END=830 /DNA_ORIENTATION=+